MPTLPLNSNPQRLWRDKLTHLQRQHATTVSAAERSALTHQIEDAQAEIARLASRTPVTGPTPAQGAPKCSCASPPSPDAPTVRSLTSQINATPITSLAQPLPTIVLLTVNDNETQAIFQVFGQSGVVSSLKTIGSVTYSDLGIHGGQHILHSICEMGPCGIGAAQQRTQDAITHCCPAAVIALGVAFGMDKTKQKIGNVLVATQIQDYELARVNRDGRLTPRGDRPKTSDPLLNRLRQINATRKMTDRRWPAVEFGLILSGQKLLDNLDYRNSLRRLYPEAIGGEMESAGVYASAARAKVDWTVVKAICDWGYRKRGPLKEARQRRAARNAALVLKASFDAGPLYPP